jgi:ribonuclease-3
MGKLLAGTRKGPSGERVRQLKKLQRKIGLTFTDLGLLEQALTHRSYSHVTSQTRNQSNERMEFLGDSVLGLAVSQFLYLQFPDRSEGALSKMKSLLVSRKVLSTVSRDAGLGEFLLLSGEESEMGGRDRASILADSFEGVIGAIYLDQGFRAANKYIQRFLLGNIHEILKDEEHTNFKSLLQEHVQSKHLSHPVYRVRREEGPEHEKEFAIEVVVRGEVWGIGRGKSKKEAEQNAARAALERRQGREAPPRRRSGREGEIGRGEGRSAKPEQVRIRGEAPRARPEEGAARAAERPRAREAPPPPPRDRGDHGILASREQLRAARRAEAEQREKEDREGRPRREDRGRSGEPRRAGDGARRRDARGGRPPTPPSMERPGIPEDEIVRAEDIGRAGPGGAEGREGREAAGPAAALRDDAPLEPRGPRTGSRTADRPGGAVAGPREPAGFGRRRRSRRGSGDSAARPRPEPVTVPEISAPLEGDARVPGGEPGVSLLPAVRVEPSPAERPSEPPIEPPFSSAETVRGGRPPETAAEAEEPAAEDRRDRESSPRTAETASAPEVGNAESASEPDEAPAGAPREPGGFHRRKRRHVRGLRRR